MIKIEKEKTGDLVKVYASDKLNQQDYDQLIPVLEKTLESWKKLRLYIEMEDFKGWTMTAALQDLGFDIRHAMDLSKIAVVGEKQWQEALTRLMKPFTTADVKFFSPAEKEEALQWVKT